jgi:hypothetical protein
MAEIHLDSVSKTYPNGFQAVNDVDHPDETREIISNHGTIRISELRRPFAVGIEHGNDAVRRCNPGIGMDTCHVPCANQAHSEVHFTPP